MMTMISMSRYGLDVFPIRKSVCLLKGHIVSVQRLSVVSRVRTVCGSKIQDFF